MQFQKVTLFSSDRRLLRDKMERKDDGYLLRISTACTSPGVVVNLSPNFSISIVS